MVRTLVDQQAAAGTFRALWDGRGSNGATAGKGVYFARFVAGSQIVDTKKIVLE
jgi:flagellar hook assembly protein FlgD